ncbi:TetR/AcrR family transcriptional regulator [Streptomyces sp. NA04227]|uniref:TetR/AcrR family transcriptional regulator n=1 Tax=Streptomyces sp. NA04227 TaxID=2742136 RepID=UPI0015901949|nr:TetR/AcrR family transcriptional regulator [Streptomyces sp. NA04227]QKW07035.1 TetR/AcrR family transcriptional regulator [Streptomyces sp. NA04227]
MPRKAASAPATDPAPDTESPGTESPDAANSPSTGRRYHHGDLRRAVLAAALEVIAADGPAALSLRDLARRAGVSHAAPAHHFGDRTGLLTAIAAEGFDLLADALGAADGLREAGVRYVRFARQRPAHFRVMFAPDLLRADDPELARAREAAGDRLREAVAGLPPEDRGQDARLASIAAWSLAHGFATLLLSHNLDAPVGDRDPEDVFADLATMLFRPGG